MTIRDRLVRLEDRAPLKHTAWGQQDAATLQAGNVLTSKEVQLSGKTATRPPSSSSVSKIQNFFPLSVFKSFSFIVHLRSQSLASHRATSPAHLHPGPRRPGGGGGVGEGVLGLSVQSTKADSGRSEPGQTILCGGRGGGQSGGRGQGRALLSWRRWRWAS